MEQALAKARPEDKVPSVELNILIEKIVAEKWHNGDKIIKDIAKMEFIEFENETKNRMEFELFVIHYNGS